MQVKPDNYSIIIFGANSDLAARKLFPSLYELAQWGNLPDDFRIIGVGRADLSDEEVRLTLQEKMARLFPETLTDEATFRLFSGRLFYVRVDLAEIEGYHTLYHELMDVSEELGIQS